jgi:nicotinate-nucleotide pyrophosphorylase (carboxylating)
VTHSAYLDNLIQSALREDIGHGDLTTSLIVRGDEKAVGIACAKGDFVLAGLEVFTKVFYSLDHGIRSELKRNDGEAVHRGDVFCEVQGKAAALLTAERVALNFLQHLCGIATLTRKFVEAVKGTKAQITDTRKTVPTLRALEKYAVRMGGGRNHRFGLFDGILIKDNHIKIAGGVREAIACARRSTPQPSLPIEVEVTSLDELQQAIEERVDIILLDNMPVEMVREAVTVTAGRATLEASGGMNLQNIREYAETGVNLISIGSLTHSAPASDISFEMAIEP